MKKILLIFSLALMCFAATAQSDMWYSKKAAVEGIQFQAGGSYFKPMRAVKWYWDEVNYCHCDDCCCGTADYLSIEFNTLIANPTVNPAIVDTAGKGYYFDDCHYHFHSDLIQHTLYNTEGAVVAGGAKMGYDWVSSGTFNPPVGTNIHDEITSIDSGWVFQSIPETLPLFGQFVISGMRDDLYPRDYDGNRIILGHWVNGSYIGVKDGKYRLHSKAYFENLGLNEGANIYPNEWEIWIEITNDTIVTLDVEPPVIVPPPPAPTDVLVDYDFKESNDPIVSWTGDASTSYQVERYIKKGQDVIGTVQMNPVNVTGTTFIDNIEHIQLAAQTYFPPHGNGVKFYYRVRAINTGGTSDWMQSEDIKL